MAYTFVDLASSAAVEKAIHSSPDIVEADKTSRYQEYHRAAFGKPNAVAREIAREIVGKPVFWDWDRA
jgi:isocitrate lyase